MHDDAWHLTIDYNFNENHAKSRQQSPRPFSSLYIMCSMCSICVPYVFYMCWWKELRQWSVSCDILLVSIFCVELRETQSSLVYKTTHYYYKHG